MADDDDDILIVVIIITTSLSLSSQKNFCDHHYDHDNGYKDVGFDGDDDGGVGEDNNDDDHWGVDN